MKDFLSFGLNETVINTLNKIQFQTPTPIQAQVIPHALEGQDILGTAQTGTGKTGAFGIPLIEKLMSKQINQALIILPTRELAVQVRDMINKLLGDNINFYKSALLIGGEPIGKQLSQLKTKKLRVIVGTPGRINDHLERGSLNIHQVNYLVLDEADRMLDMGFTPQIDAILKFLPEAKQTLLFSATMPPKVALLTKKYLKDPVHISVGSNSEPLKNLDQQVVYLAEDDKYPNLLANLDKRQGSAIIFVKTKRAADKMAKRLRTDNHSAEAIHGDLSHSKRERTIASFRASKFKVMVATDIAARGLDIPHVKHVINFDLPQCPEDYIHRLGRTARNGQEGASLCFVTSADKLKWKLICRVANIKDESPLGPKNSSRKERSKKPFRKFNDKAKFKKADNKSSGDTSFFKKRRKSA